jgi:hypothetical protein
VCGLSGVGRVIPCDTNRMHGVDRNQAANYAATVVLGQAFRLSGKTRETNAKTAVLIATE